MLYGKGTNVWAFSVYEWTPGLFSRHGTIMHGSDLGESAGWFGRLGTRQLPQWIDAIPVGPRRLKTVGRWHRAQYRAAYKVILANLPEWAKGGKLSAYMGEITVRLSHEGGESVNLAV